MGPLPQPICDACLASLARVPLDEVRVAVAILALLAKVERCLGRCATCHRAGEVNVGVAWQRRMRRVLAMLDRRRGQPVCQPCAARKLGLAPREIRRTVWGLRALRVVVVARRPCALCERTRLTLALPR